MEIRKEILPEAAALVDTVARNEPWSPVYRRALEELFKAPALRAALNEILVTSDSMLKNAGMTDFTDENAVKAALRTQGTALGLVQAVELICELAATPENPLTEENKHD